MLCLMHDGEPYGHLMIQGRAMMPDALARLVGEAAPAVKRWLRELEDNQVFSRDAAGAIYSRRMVRDEAVREARSTGGSAGAEHGIKGASHGAKGGRPRGDKNPPQPDADGGKITPLSGEEKPPPSSSSSSSSSSPNDDDDEARDAREWPTELIEITSEVCRIAGIGHTQPGHIIANHKIVQGWLDAGIDPETEIAPAIRQAIADTTERISSLRYFDAPVRQAKARQEAHANGHSATRNGTGRSITDGLWDDSPAADSQADRGAGGALSEGGEHVH